MDASTPSFAAETKALREAYAALNRNDVAGLVAVFDPQVVRVEWPDSAQEGTYRGIEAVTAHVAMGRGTWAEGGCEPERFVVAGDRIVVLVQVRVRLKDETEWREGRTADVYTFRNGKVVEFRTFADEREAMEWVNG